MWGLRTLWDTEQMEERHPPRQTATPSVIKVRRSSHLRALSHSASARRPISPPGPASIGRAAVARFAGPTVEEVAILASRAVVALKEENGSTKGAIKHHIEAFYACDIPEQALTGALRKPAFVEHERGRFMLRVTSAVNTTPTERQAPSPAPHCMTPSHAAKVPRVHVGKLPNGPDGLDWWRTPVKVAVTKAKR